MRITDPEERASSKEKNKFYVYLHIKADSGEPFYVGKGTRSRSTRTDGRSNWWKRIVYKHGFDVIFLEKDLSEMEALEKETYWINRIGRKDLGNGPLVNFTNGGEGTSGFTFSHTQETKNKIGASQIGRVSAFIGKSHTQESKEKMSCGHKGKILSQDTRDKMSISKTGTTLSQETKDKISSALKLSWKIRKEKTQL